MKLVCLFAVLVVSVGASKGEELRSDDRKVPSMFLLRKGKQGPPGPKGLDSVAVMGSCSNKLKKLEDEFAALEKATRAALQKLKGQADDQLTCAPDKSTYQIHHIAQNYPDAGNTCKRLGGNLAFQGVENSADRKHVIESHGGRTGQGYLFGFNDNAEEESWVNQNSVAVSMTTLGWRRGEPNGGTRENCAMDCSYKGELCDISCYTRRPFVCQIPTCSVYSAN